MNITRQEIEDLLVHEEEPLDEFKLKEWATSFASNGTYFVHDDRARLEQGRYDY